VREVSYQNRLISKVMELLSFKTPFYDTENFIKL